MQLKNSSAILAVQEPDQTILRKLHTIWLHYGYHFCGDFGKPEVGKTIIKSWNSICSSKIRG